MGRRTVKDMRKVQSSKFKVQSSKFVVYC